jgi:hypothetical protein
MTYSIISINLICDFLWLLLLLKKLSSHRFTFIKSTGSALIESAPPTQMNTTKSYFEIFNTKLTSIIYKKMALGHN